MGLHDSTISIRERAALAAGVGLLALQLAFFVRARFTGSRYFCWAPFHSEARYTIDATIAGRALSDDEVARRYGFASYYWEQSSRTNWELNSIVHVTDTVRATEAAFPVGERAAVVITYRVNGHPTERWRCP